MGKVYFISGHLDITDEEFKEHYEPIIIKAHNEGAGFVVGDAVGVDVKAQELLIKIGALAVVYHMFEKPRNNAGFMMRGGYTSDNSRDKAMTTESNADIAWVRPGREKSGTAKNLKRRKS